MGFALFKRLDSFGSHPGSRSREQNFGEWRFFPEDIVLGLGKIGVLERIRGLENQLGTDCPDDLVRGGNPNLDLVVLHFGG